MRSAAYFARIAGETVADLECRDIFVAATTGGARALQRQDIGRLAVGARADFVLVDTRAPSMMPLREPVRSLLMVAAERPIRAVYVDGSKVVEDGRCLTIDLADASLRLEAAQARSLERTSSLDWAGRTADQLSPMVFETVR